jgi:hypothetical protein
MQAGDSRNQCSNTTAEPASKFLSNERTGASLSVEKSVEQALTMVGSIPQAKRCEATPLAWVPLQQQTLGIVAISEETTVEGRLAVSAPVP